MHLPHYILAGVPRAGTTSLYQYLRGQPGVHVSELKEINFLSYPGETVARDRYPWLDFPVTTFDAYARLWADTGDRVSVDFSASCFRSEVALERIRQFVPDAGLILLLRDPVERAWSAYQNRVRKGYEQRPPDEALVAGERSVDMGFYSERVAQFRDELHEDRVAVWLLDDLRADPAGTLRDMLVRIGATPSEPVVVAGVHNQGSLPRYRALNDRLPDHAARRVLRRRLPSTVRRPIEWAWRRTQRPAEPMPRELEARLRLLYADDVRRLEILLGRDLAAWLPPSAAGH